MKNTKCQSCPIETSKPYHRDGNRSFCSKVCLEASEAQKFALSLPRAYRRTKTALLPCQEASRAVLEWEPNPDDGGKAVLFVFGSTGSGKTRTCLAAAEAMIRTGQMQADEAVNLRSGEFADDVIDRTKPNGIGGFRGYFQSLTECSLLILDEVDKLNFTPKVSTVFLDLVEERTSNERATIFISQRACSVWIADAIANHKKGTHVETFQAIERRLKEFSRPVNFIR